MKLNVFRLIGIKNFVSLRRGCNSMSSITEKYIFKKMNVDDELWIKSGWNLVCFMIMLINSRIILLLIQVLVLKWKLKIFRICFRLDIISWHISKTLHTFKNRFSTSKSLEFFRNLKKSKNIKTDSLTSFIFTHCNHD